MMLPKKYKKPDALKILTATIFQRQQKGYTIDAWQLPRGDEIILPKETRTVGDCMSSRTITALETDSAELVLRMMLWNDIHHLPILNDDLDLSGLLTWTDVETYLKDPKKLEMSIRELMKKDLVTTTSETSLESAVQLMKSRSINCLPVVRGKKLIGIITSNDV